MKNLFTLLLCVSAHLVQAQAIRPFKIFDIGTSGNINVVSGDAETIRRTSSAGFNLGYNFNPYFNLVGEFQLGKLAGGDSLSFSGRQFRNRFKSLLIRSQIHLGTFIGRTENPLINASRSLYVSSGIGLIENNISEINRQSHFNEDFYRLGRDQSISPFIPVRVGYEWKIQNPHKETLFKLDFAYQHNLVLGDEVDGFSAGKFRDVFSQVSLGLKIGLYREWRHLY